MVLWSTKNVKAFYLFNNKVPHGSCVIYKGKCPCSKTYIRETIRNSATRWDEHEHPNGNQNTKNICTIALLMNVPGIFALSVSCWRKLLEELLKFLLHSPHLLYFNYFLFNHFHFLLHCNIATCITSCINVGSPILFMKWSCFIDLFSEYFILTQEPENVNSISKKLYLNLNSVFYCSFCSFYQMAYFLA